MTHKSRHRKSASSGQARFLLILSVLMLCLPPFHTVQAHSEDRRLTQGNNSPAWLNAIVRLQVPGIRLKEGQRRHHIEDCSATLVSTHQKSTTDTLVTAWHCLEMYKDLSKALTVTFKNKEGTELTREVYRLADGGSMDADWAILRIYNAPATDSVTALSIHPGKADSNRTITMAGFSKDAGLGRDGESLTFDPACHITAIERSATATDCSAHKGASGGAVVQLSASGVPLLSGVISEGNGENYSSFVPVAHFRAALELHLGRLLQPRF